MAEKHPSDSSEGEPQEGQSTGAGSGDDSAFDRLLHDAAKVSSPGRLLTPGTRLSDGRFVIRRRLGEGGMGVVFEALDTRADTTVAIKTLSRVDAAGIYRMKREFRSLAGVTHPYLVPLYELFADGDLWFFTMGLIDGERFDRYLRAHKGAPLDEARLRGVLAQLAAGVQAIHNAGKLHRDLKPSNVLVANGANGPRVAVLDFGLTSEASSPGATQTVEHGVAGTPAYMAPEQARGQRATAASDWYAVGVMLFESLTGRLPFEGESLEQLLLKQTQLAPAARSLAPDAPEDLAELCDRLLAKDAAQRPAPAEIHRITGSEQLSPTQASHPSSTTGSSFTGGDAGAETDAPSPELAETFVGRAREIGVLETAFGDTNDGKPVVVMVSGPSGMGKTTFVEHFLASVKARGDAVVLGGRCYQRESVPFKGFDGVIDALSRYLVRLPEADAARLVPRQAAALCRVFPVLGRVQPISSAPQRRGLPNDQVELRYRAFEALKELLSKLAEERPLILSIDDLQWSDRDSARLLRHLLTPPDPPMLLLVATHRDDEPDAEGLASVRTALSEDTAGREVDVRTLALGPLTAAESRRLAQQLLSAGEREYVERIAREAAGSPFLIGELTRAAHKDDNPGDLRSAVLTRVAGLPEHRRAVLHALCVAPRPVTAELLASVVEAADVPTEVRALLGSRLAREVASAGAHTADSGRRLACYHDRIRETVLDAMDAEERAAWHRRYGAALEASESLDLDALVDHALGAGESARGGEYARRAARQAVEALAFDQAATLYETALAHLQLTDAERADLLVELAQARTGSGRCGDAAQLFLQAAELDPTRGQELQRRAGEQFFINGDVAAGSDAMRRALADAGIDYDELSDPSAVTPAYIALLQRGFEFERKSAEEIDSAALARLDTLWAAALGTTWLLQAPMLSLSYVREALELGEPLQVARGRALFLATIEAPTDPPGARRRLAELVTFLDEFDTPSTRAWTALCRGAVTLFAGSDDLGLADLRRAEELLMLPENRGMQRELTVCRTGLLMALIDGNGPDSMVELLIRYMRLADEAGDRYGRMQWRCNFAGALYDRLGADRVRAEINLGLELTEGLDQPRMRGTALTTLATVETLEGNYAEAWSLAQQTFGRIKGRDWDSLRQRFGRACTLLAAVAHDVGDRATALTQVERDANLLAKPLSLVGEPIQYPILAGVPEYLHGQLAAAAGKQREARELFEAALAIAEGPAHPSPGFQHVVRARLGDLIGGARSAELRAQAHARLREGGHRSPAWLDFFAARFE